MKANLFWMAAMLVLVAVFYSPGDLEEPSANVTLQSATPSGCAYPTSCSHAKPYPGFRNPAYDFPQYSAETSLLDAP